MISNSLAKPICTRQTSSIVAHCKTFLLLITLSAQSGTALADTTVALLKGCALYERWLDPNSELGDLDAFAAALATGATRAPDFSSKVKQFGAPWNVADQYKARVRTCFIPPSSGNYVFFVAGDDQCTVYLSPDENPANKKIICRENSWSNQYQWTTPSGGLPEDKRSDLS